MKASSLILRDRARDLRNNDTDAERALWLKLRARQLAGFKFRRQQPIGPYIVDFCCVECGLVVELDGGQHADQAADDERRTALLEREGYRVLRFWNDQVLKDCNAVLEIVVDAINAAFRWRASRGGTR